MNKFSTYFIKDKDKLISKNECIIMGDKYRFTVLTERLVRLEYSVNGIFEDRATSRVVFRDFDKPIFSKSESETLIQITTKYFTLMYVKNRPFSSSKLTPGNTLKVILKETDREWYYGHPEVRNFGGTNYSLDSLDNELKLENGLYSTDGFSVIDDSNSYVLNADGDYIPRETKVIDLYLFMYKNDFGLCLRDYYTLTGYPSFLPRYALGNWWYKNEDYNYSDIENLLTKFNDNDIPLSVLLLGNTWNDKVNTYDFNPNINIDLLNKLLSRKKIKLGLTIEPNIPIENSNNKYNEITRYFKLDNKKFSFIPIDSTKLGLYFNTFIREIEKKVNLFYIDYNNISDRINLWYLNHYHYVELGLSFKERPLILSRNPNIAPHRYPILYSGETKVSWNTLSILPYYNLSASNMGVSWWAHAIGGYTGGVEDSELYMRYIQFGTFSPIFILASDKGKYYKREPWKWNQLRLSVIKEYMQLRHKLIPYIYTEGYFYHKTGLPLIQPLYYSYPEIYDEPLYKNQYYFGSQIMVAPITKKKNSVMNRVVQRVFVPKGTWYDFKSGKKFPGNKYYISFYRDEDYPVFCKAGAIIPLENDNMYEFMIFPGENGKYTLYEDDGITDEYKNGTYLMKEIDYRYEPNSYIVRITNKEGVYSSKINNYSIRFRNTKIPKSIMAMVNNNPWKVTYEFDKSDFVVTFSNIPMNSNIVLSISGDNLEIEAVTKIYEDIAGIIDDLEVTTLLKEKIDSILFSDLSIRKKRIEIRKLKKYKLEPKFIKMFINLLEYINEV